MLNTLSEFALDLAVGQDKTIHRRVAHTQTHIPKNSSLWATPVCAKDNARRAQT